MRQKRAKAYKRVMALYVSAFNFRQPYQVLASSDFLVEAGKSPEIDILKMMGTTVQGEIKPSEFGVYEEETGYVLDGVCARVSYCLPMRPGNGYDLATSCVPSV